METNNQSSQPATGCLKWAAAGILVVIALAILGNLPLIFNCAIILVLGAVGVAIVVGCFYFVFLLFQKLKGESHANR